MKMTKVAANSRKRVFEVQTRGRRWVFPYSQTSPAPSGDDPVIEVFVDPELGREAFTYLLASGAEGSVHMDSVLEYNRDPKMLADIAMYLLTVETKERFEASPLSAREVARRLGTSPAQLYRLLDTTNYSKSMRQLVSLLVVLGYDVEIAVKERAADRPVG